MDQSVAKLRAGVDTLLATGQYQRVIDICKQALAIARKDTDKAAEAASLIGLAGAYRYMGKFEEARIFCNGALTFSREARNDDLLADGLVESSLIALEGGAQLDSARDDVHEALSIAHEADYWPGITAALYAAGRVYVEMEQYDRAARYAREALEYAREINVPVLQLSALAVLGYAMGGMRQFASSQRALRDALDGTREAGYRSLHALTLHYLGRVEALRDPQSVEAITHHSDALTTARRISYMYLVFSALHGLGLVHRQRGEFNTARDQFNAMLSVADKIDNKTYEATVYMNFGMLHYSQQGFEISLDYFNRALELYRESANPFYEAMALQWLAMTYARQHAYDLALENLWRARAVYVSLDHDVAAGRIMTTILWTYVLAAIDRVLRLVGYR